MASTSLIRSIAHSINQKQEYCNTKENSLDDKSSFIGTFPSVDWIQNTAIINLFSKRGEMFSADNLCALAEISFQQFFHHSMVPNTFKAHVLKRNVYSFLTSYDKIVDFFTDSRYHQVMNIFIRIEYFHCKKYSVCLGAMEEGGIKTRIKEYFCSGQLFRKH